jgi:prefoldin subunit 5
MCTTVIILMGVVIVALVATIVVLAKKCASLDAIIEQYTKELTELKQQKQITQNNEATVCSDGTTQSIH